MLQPGAKVPVTPVSKDTPSCRTERCPWQEHGFCCLWRVGGRAGRQFLPSIYPQEWDLCADTFLLFIYKASVQIPHGVKNSSKTTDPFRVVMGWTWCKKWQDNITYLCNVCSKHLRTVAPPPAAGSRCSHTALHHGWALLTESPMKASSGASLSCSLPCLSILLKVKKAMKKLFA